MINKFNKTISLISAGILFTSNGYIISAHADTNKSNYFNQSTEEFEYIKLDYEHGYINNAVAFAENKFYISGNMDTNIDNDTYNNYYLSGDNSTSLTDFSDYDLSLYGKNYLSAENSNYYVNLETGEVIEDDLQENNLLQATINLRKKMKKSANDRYSDYYKAKSLHELTNYKFNDTWYETEYHSINPTNGNDSNSPLIVYTDIEGNYIDADYNLGTIEVVTTNKTVSINNTDKISKGTSIAVSNQQTIGHDNSNIYRTVTLTITSDEEIHKINGLPIQDIEDSAFNISNDGQIVSFDVIQKISKKQSKKNIYGAKYSDTVSTYILSDSEWRNISLSPNSNYSIFDENIISYSIDNNKITICKITLETSSDYNFINTKRLASTSFDAYDIDSSGELWILKSGFIYRYETDGWLKTYRVDGLMDNLSIYD